MTGALASASRSRADASSGRPSGVAASTTRPDTLQTLVPGGT